MSWLDWFHKKASQEKGGAKKSGAFIYFKRALDEARTPLIEDPYLAQQVVINFYNKRYDFGIQKSEDRETIIVALVEAASKLAASEDPVRELRSWSFLTKEGHKDTLEISRVIAEHHSSPSPIIGATIEHKHIPSIRMVFSHPLPDAWMTNNPVQNLLADFATEIAKERGRSR